MYTHFSLDFMVEGEVFKYCTILGSTRGHYSPLNVFRIKK